MSLIEASLANLIPYELELLGNHTGAVCAHEGENKIHREKPCAQNGQCASLIPIFWRFI